MGTFADSLENSWLGHILAYQTFTKPTVLALSLHTADPGDTGANECANSNNYGRVSCLTSFGTAAAARAITQDADITFNQASGSWGTVSHWALWDNATYGAGNCLAGGSFSVSKAVGNGQTPKVLSGEVVISVPASNGMTTYLANEMLDHTFLSGDGGFTVSALYMALGTAAFGDTGVWTNECANSGAYARDTVTTAFSVTGSAGTTDEAITFVTATGSWGTVSDWALADSATYNGGNMFLYGTFDASNAITTDDQVNIPIGDLDINLS
jgi:hypothetical protein